MNKKTLSIFTGTILAGTMVFLLLMNNSQVNTGNNLNTFTNSTSLSKNVSDNQNKLQHINQNNTSSEGLINPYNSSIVGFLANGTRVSPSPNSSQSAILMKVGIENINTTRNTTVMIPVIFSYQSMSDQDTAVTIDLPSKTSKHFYMPPSVTAKYAHMQFNLFSNSTQMPQDVIDLDSLTDFVPKKIMLIPNQNKTVAMYITIPQSWSDEMLHRVIIVNVDADIVPHMKVIPYGSTSVRVVVDK